MSRSDGTAVGRVAVEVEVVFSKALNVFYRHQLTLTLGSELSAGMRAAIDAFHTKFPKVDLLRDGVSFTVQRRSAD